MLCPIAIIKITARIVEMMIFFLDFMFFVKRELCPSQADSERKACNTIVYFAVISDITSEITNLSAPVNDEIATVIPKRYDEIATTPAEPIIGSWITLYFFSMFPFTIIPSAKSASASV